MLDSIWGYVTPCIKRQIPAFYLKVANWYETIKESVLKIFEMSVYLS